MSTTPDPAKPKSSAFSRYFFVFILGGAIGAVATVMGIRAWQQGQDHFPESVMFVQEWHMKQLGEKAAANHCNATDIIPHLNGLRTMADDLERAFPGAADDERFTKQASGMRATLARRRSPPISSSR